MDRPPIEFDWTEIILDLRRAGMGQGEIARATNKASGEAAIRQYLAGVTPAHWRGEILLQLWSERTGKPRESAPTRPAKLYVAHGRRRSKRSTALVRMPHEHLLTVAEAYGLTVPEMLRLLGRGHRLGVKAARNQKNLALPGFES